MTPLVKYFGNRTKEFGRPLWEIVLNLKNFGRGRLIVRPTISEKYPKEPCFYKILSVHPHLIEYPETFHGNIIVEEVFRGYKRTDPVDIGEFAGASGFRLILKEDEPSFLKGWEAYKKNPLPLAVLPRTAPLPPLWRELLAKEKGIRVEDVPEIPITHDPIEPGVGTPRRLAVEGEEPSYRLGVGNWKPIYPQFLKHLLSKEKFGEKYAVKPDPDFIYLDKKLKPIDISTLLEKEKPEMGVKS